LELSTIADEKIYILSTYAIFSMANELQHSSIESSRRILLFLKDRFRSMTCGAWLSMTHHTNDVVWKQY
jgi:hypothetical protein